MSFSEKNKIFTEFHSKLIKKNNILVILVRKKNKLYEYVYIMRNKYYIKIKIKKNYEFIQKYI